MSTPASQIASQDLFWWLKFAVEIHCSSDTASDASKDGAQLTSSSLINQKSAYAHDIFPIHMRDAVDALLAGEAGIDA
jgi:hypothetical protein